MSLLIYQNFAAVPTDYTGFPAGISILELEYLSELLNLVSLSLFLVLYYTSQGRYIKFNSPSYILIFMQPDFYFLSIIDVGLQFDTPCGVMYLLSPPLLEPDRHKTFPDTLKKEYIEWLNTDDGKNRKLLTSKRRSDYCYFLKNPNEKSILADKKDRRREATEKFYFLKHFELQDKQIYGKAEAVHGKYFLVCKTL